MKSLVSVWPGFCVPRVVKKTVLMQNAEFHPVQVSVLAARRYRRRLLLSGSPTATLDRPGAVGHAREPLHRRCMGRPSPVTAPMERCQPAHRDRRALVGRSTPAHRPHVTSTTPPFEPATPTLTTRAGRPSTLRTPHRPHVTGRPSNLRPADVLIPCSHCTLSGRRLMRTTVLCSLFMSGLPRPLPRPAATCSSCRLLALTLTLPSLRPSLSVNPSSGPDLNPGPNRDLLLVQNGDLNDGTGLSRVPPATNPNP